MPRSFFFFFRVRCLLCLVVVRARRIEFCREGTLTGHYCCPKRCGKTCGQECRGGEGRCCPPMNRRRRQCTSIAEVDCFVANRTEDVSGQVSDCKDCVALLLTGHMRTFERTRHSLRRYLASANEKSQFDLIIATYENQDASTNRYGDASRHTTRRDGSPVTRERLDVAYGSVHRWSATRYHVFREDEIGAILPRDFKRYTSPKFRKPEHVEQIKRIKRSLALVQQGIVMVRDLEEQRQKSYEFIVRLRPDIELLKPILLDRVMTTRNENAIVVPESYDARGGLRIQAKQLATRPCSQNGTITPKWVQDHMAIATLPAFWHYARFYHSYLKPHIFSPHVETSLAKYLTPTLSIRCVDIRYTIRR